jgi:hypothetical protein
MMEWFKNIAPMLGTALGGPLGGAAATFIADKLGLDEKTVDAVSTALRSGSMNPDQIAQIKLAEIEFQKFLKQNSIDLESIHAADRRSAREMYSATKSIMPAILTCGLGLGFMFVLTWMLNDPSVKESAPLMIMLGVLGAEFTASCKFWFGTTSSSADKNFLLANSTPNK